MKKIYDLLSELENKIKENILNISSLRNVNNDLRVANIDLLNKNKKIKEDLKLLENRFKAFKIANTISGSHNNINETKGEINSLISEIDLCISHLSD